jgi:hypothetical protein
MEIEWVIETSYLGCIQLWKTRCPKTARQCITNCLILNLMAQQVVIYIPEEGN